MAIAVRQNGEVSILDLSGKITLATSSEELVNTVRELLHRGHRSFILNLSEVPYTDSAGMADVARSWIMVDHQGGKCVLSGACKRITDRLKITKLDRVFQVFPDEAAALASFNQSVPV